MHLRHTLVLLVAAVSFADAQTKQPAAPLLQPERRVQPEQPPDLLQSAPVRTFSPDAASLPPWNTQRILDSQEKLVAAADRLQAAVRDSASSESDGGFGAIELDPNLDAVHLYWKQAQQMPAAVSDMAYTITREGVPVMIHSSPFSHTDLTAEAERLMDEAAPRSFSEVSVQPMASGLGVEFNSAVDSTLGHIAVKAMESRLYKRRAAGYGGGDESFVTRSVGQAKRHFSRHDDSSPWKGGAEIAVGTSGCSTGFAVGSWFGRYMLAAGHCVAWSDNVPVYDGSRELMGLSEGARDAEHTYRDSTLVKLLSWKNIGRIYDGGVDVGEFTKPVKRAIDSYVNQYVCTSGAFSGARCDIRVETAATYIDDFIGHRFLYVKARQISGLAAAGDGDSGGPVFALDAQSNVLATGIINAGDPNSKAACSGVIFDSRYGNRHCSSVLYYTPIWSMLNGHGVWLETN